MFVLIIIYNRLLIFGKELTGRLRRPSPDSLSLPSVSEDDFDSLSPILKHLYPYLWYQIRLVLTRVEIKNGAQLEKETRFSNLRPAMETCKLLLEVDIDPRLRTWYSFQRYDHEFACFAIMHALSNYPPGDREYLGECFKIAQTSGATFGWSFPSKLSDAET